MKIDRLKLKKALETVKPGLGKDTYFEQADSFAFAKGFILTFNNEVCMKYPLDEVDFQGAVESEEIYKFLAKSKSDEISLEVEEDTLVMKSGRSKAGVPINEELFLPVGEISTDDSDWVDIPEGFTNACAFAVESCSDDELNPKINCVHITKEGIVESTDNLRISHWKLDEKLEIEDVLIPGKSLTKVIGVKPEKMKIDESWAHFKNAEGVFISCRIVAETFPNTSPVLNHKKEGIDVHFPESIDEVLDKAQIFIEKQSGGIKYVSVTTEGNKFTVESSSERGWFKEEIETEFENTSVSFNINPNFLKSILKLSDTCKLIDNMIEFKGENWVYITMTILKND